MRNAGMLRAGLALLLGFNLGLMQVVHAQVASKPTAACHVTDGQFTPCPGGKTEWSDVQPLFFPSSNSYLYVNQDDAHGFIWLMYDFPFRTKPMASTDSVQVTFDTVEQDPDGASLEHYVINIFGSGQIQVVDNGEVEAPGRIAGATGFHPSPNSPIPHLMAELQVPLTPGTPTAYSPDPIFWSATVPPTPPSPPDPPSCPPFAACNKTQDQITAWQQAADAANAEAQQILANGQMICSQPLQNLEAQLETAVDALNVAVTSAKTAIGRAELPSSQSLSLMNALEEVETQADELLSDPGASVEPLETAIGALGAILAAVTSSTVVAEVTAALTTAALVVAAGFAVAAAAEVLASGVCFAGFELAASLELAKAEFYQELADDPPDPNFMVIATPVVPTLPGQPLASMGFSPQVTSDLNSLVMTFEQEIALLQVIPITINRVGGAVAAGNTFWQAQQAQAAQKYASQLASLLQNELSVRSALTNDFAASNVVFTFSSSQVQTTLGQLEQNGLPAKVSSALTQLGLGPSAQSDVLQAVRSVSSTLVGSLGTGTFPRALTDPSLATATNAAAGAFTSLATAAPPSALTTSFDTTLPGDYTAAGVGLRGLAQGTVAISGIPAGASVQKALLYWGMLDDGEDPTLKQLTFNGTAITGERIGAGPDTCWGRSNSFTYRADVTPFVAGNGTFNLTNVANGGFILGEGASLVVIYQAAGLPSKTVMVADGNVVFPAVASGATSFQGFSALGPVSAKTTFMVGDGQVQTAGPTPVSFIGSLGKINFSGLFSANDGPFWDTDTFNVSSVTGAASSNGSATITLNNDCLLWSAQAFSVTSPAANPAPVTATAAVVKTDTAGNTAVNAMGLTAADMPTIQDKVAMIVLNRVIENRTTSPGALTTQLVNSIPSSLLPPTEAGGVVKSVLQRLVQSNIKFFDTCLRDDSSGNLFQFNSITGAYLFTRCSDNFQLSGTGTVSEANSVLTLTDNKPDRIISASFLTNQLTGRANVTLISSPGLSQTITISATNPQATCSCGGR
ncbi:MAG TPA: hypothetical protein VI756_20030 [Blastocatellia bacterium]